MTFPGSGGKKKPQRHKVCLLQIQADNLDGMTHGFVHTWDPTPQARELRIGVGTVEVQSFSLRLASHDPFGCQAHDPLSMRDPVLVESGHYETASPCLVVGDVICFCSSWPSFRLAGFCWPMNRESRAKGGGEGFIYSRVC